LGSGEVLIGRRDDADIVINEASVSQSHARVVHRRDGYYLCDLESRNGTKLNGEAVNESRLRKKDRIQIGGTTLVFLEESAPEATLTVVVDSERVEQRGGGIAQRVPEAERSLQKQKQTKLDMVEREPNGLVEAVRTAIRVGRLIRRYAWLLVPLPLLGLVAGYVSLGVYPAPEVAAAAVKLTQQQQLNPVDEGAHQQPGDGATPTFFADPEKDFANPELTKTTLTALGLAPDPYLVQDTTSRLRLEQDTASSGSVYVATFSQKVKPPPLFSTVEFLEKYLDTYLAHEVDQSIRVIKAEAGFVEQELGKLEHELHDIETELLEYQKKHISSLPEQAIAAISNKADLASRRSELELDVDRLRVQVANTQAQLGQSDSVVSRRVDDLKPLKTELESKQRQLSDLRAKGYKPEHPDVVQLTNQIDSIQREIDRKMHSDVSELERITDPRQQELSRQLVQYKGDLRVAEAGLARVSQQLGEVAGIAAAAPEVEATVLRLKRRQESLLGLRSQLFERHRKTQVQIDLETAQVRSRYEIISHTDLQPRYTRKFLGMRLGGGFGGGLLIAVATGAVFELRRFLRQNHNLLRV
jgi:hypothetical protein